MPPSDILKFSKGEFFGKRIMFRRQHFNVQFTSQRADSDGAQALLQSVIGGGIKRVGPSIGNWGYFHLPVKDDDLLTHIENLRGRQGIDFAEPDIMFIATVTPSDPPFELIATERQWALEKIDMFRAWDIQEGTDEVIVGILDSGLPLDSGNNPGQVINSPLGAHLHHEDLDGVRFLAGKNYIKDEPWPFDDYWYHGDFVAGVIAATANNNTGIAGMNWKSPIYLPKVLFTATEMGAAPAAQPSLRSTSALVHMGIRDLLEFSGEPTEEMEDSVPRRAVINLCIQIENDNTLDEYPEGTLKAIFSLVAKKEAIICISAGNVGDGVQSPGATGLAGEDAANVLVVGAINDDDERYGTTCFGHGEMVFAPGHDILTTYKPLADYSKEWGTSMATPHVSALASLMWSEAPEKSPTEIVGLLKETCRLPDAAAQNSYRDPAGVKLMGKGIINAYEALKILKSRICLVLDRSGSMNNYSGVGGTTRLDLLKQAACDLVDTVDVGSSLGIVSFNESADMDFPMTVIEDPNSNPATYLGQQIVADIRAEMSSKIHALAPGGWTSIRSGIEKAWEMLKSEKKPKAIIVLTDGMENQVPSLEDLMAESPSSNLDIPVFAIGWGSPEDLEPSGLMALTQATGGYLVMVDQYDEFGADDLTKFLAQIIGEISGYEPILDPKRTVKSGPPDEIPVLVGGADTVGEVIIFKPAQIPLEVRVLSPGRIPCKDLRTWTSESGRVMRCRFYPRSAPAAPDADDNDPWRVQVSIPSDFPQRSEVPYTLLVQSRSRLKMDCRMRQEDNLPGSVMTMMVDLTDRGTPLDSKVSLEVQVTDPGGTSHLVDQDRTMTGDRTFSFRSEGPGIYRWRVLCTGKNKAGATFQREFRLTGAIWIPAPDSDREGKALRGDNIKESG
jgi:hypothetical protein